MQNRRDFLVKMGLLTAATGLGAVACKESYRPPVIGTNDKINVGMVGCGQKGVSQVW